MNLFAIDIGTTSCKAGLFAPDGRPLRIARRPTPLRRAAEGHTYYDPEELWQTAASAIGEAAGHPGTRSIGVVGVASMGEAGLLVDVRTGAPRSAFVPWNDPCATPQAALLHSAADPRERFLATGWRAGFKCSLAKILWLRDRDPEALRGAAWLSVAGYIAYRLTGAMGMDYSLAGRTFAFDVTRREWDGPWLRSLGLDPGLFPPATPSGMPIGRTMPGGPGLPAGVPVGITGHDHVCASFAAGIGTESGGGLAPGAVFNSMGTAEAIMGVLPARPLTAADHASGFAFGCHTVPDMLYWLGGISASGGSVEWLRGLLGERPLPYRRMAALLDQAGDAPTGILYFPFLAGRGSPHSDMAVRGAFTGLSAAHGRPHLVKAAVEGVCYEVAATLRAAEAVTGRLVDRLLTVGGGARLPAWLQIKADVTGCAVEARAIPEPTLLGAARAGGAGAGLYGGFGEAAAAARPVAVKLVAPDPGRHEAYRRLFETGYEPMSAALHRLAAGEPP